MPVASPASSFQNSDFIVWPHIRFAPSDFVPDAFVDVIEENFREQFHAADGERPFQFPGDDECVQAAGETPRNCLGKTAIMFFGHAES
jgi:hypothetical protein